MPPRFTGIPRGASFDLRSGQWFIARPTEPRPYYEYLLRTGDRDFVTFIGGHNDAFVMISPPFDKPGESVKAERLTQAEYQALIPATGPNGQADEDSLITGAGPLIGVSLTSPTSLQLKPGEVGLIIAPGIRMVGSEITAGPGLDACELRSALFLWDYLDWPSSDLFPEPVNAETEFLAQAGILTRTQFHTMGVMHSKKELLSLGQKAFDYAERREPGRWSIGQGESADADRNEAGSRSFLVSLGNLITIPSAEVPLEEVLEFRAKRRGELLALRHHVAETYQRIRAAPDRALAIVSETDALVRAIEDQRRVANEAGWRKVLGSLKTHVKLDKLGAAGAAAVSTFMMSGSVSAALSAGAGTVAVKATFDLKRQSDKTPLDYVISIDRKFSKR